MTQRKEVLKELLRKRNVTLLQREAVQPVDMYNPPSSSRLTGRSSITSPLGVIDPARERPSPQLPLTTRKMKPYASYMSEESYKRLRIIAIKDGRKLYEVMQEAFDSYIQAKERRNH